MGLIQKCVDKLADLGNRSVDPEYQSFLNWQRGLMSSIDFHEKSTPLRLQINDLSERLEKEIDARRSEGAMIRDDIAALREFVHGCAEFSDKVVERVNKLEKGKPNVKAPKARKGK